MTELNVNNSTGLPEAPGTGTFWRVGESQRSMSIFDIGPSGAYVALVKRWTEKSTVAKVHKILWWTLEWGTKEIDVTREGELVRVYIQKTETREEDVFDEDDTKIGIRDVPYKKSVYKNDLTKELVFEHVELAIEEYNRLTEAHGLLGDYPPNHIDTPREARKELLPQGHSIIFKNGDKK